MSAIYADDETTEFIPEPVSLLGRCREIPVPAGGPDPVDRAEEAIRRISDHFGRWMDDEIRALLEAWQRARQASLDDETLPALFRAAIDIKGQAETLGFPLAGRIAGLLCRILEQAEKDAVPEIVIERHVDAIKAVVREDVRHWDDPQGSELLAAFIEIAERYAPEPEIDAA